MAPSGSFAATQFPGGMAQIVDRYDGVLLDQWGVLHDGTTAYPAARDCLQRLKAAGKAVVILSNSGRSGSDNELVLAGMGFSRQLYDHIVSAGDDARDALRVRTDSPYRDLGRRCLLLARPGEEHLAGGLGLDFTEDPARADFILAMSMESKLQSVAGWNGLLRAAAARGLPLICANPDRHRVHADGSLLEAPGAVARAYEELGGVVHYHGKPQLGIYRTCLRLLGLAPSRVLAIGDSLDHDIVGASGAGLDSVFIAGGIHRQDLAWTGAGVPEPQSCTRLFAGASLAPGYCLPFFAWL